MFYNSIFSSFIWWRIDIKTGFKRTHQVKGLRRPMTVNLKGQQEYIFPREVNY